jgi:hypothetical protein
MNRLPAGPYIPFYDCNGSDFRHSVDPFPFSREYPIVAEIDFALRIHPGINFGHSGGKR